MKIKNHSSKIKIRLIRPKIQHLNERWKQKADNSKVRVRAIGREKVQNCSLFRCIRIEIN